MAKLCSRPRLRHRFLRLTLKAALVLAVLALAAALLLRPHIRGLAGWGIARALQEAGAAGVSVDVEAVSSRQLVLRNVAFSLGGVDVTRGRLVVDYRWDALLDGEVGRVCIGGWEVRIPAPTWRAWTSGGASGGKAPSPAALPAPPPPFLLPVAHVRIDPGMVGVADGAGGIHGITISGDIRREGRRRVEFVLDVAPDQAPLRIRGWVNTLDYNGRADVECPGMDLARALAAHRGLLPAGMTLPEPLGGSLKFGAWADLRSAQLAQAGAKVDIGGLKAGLPDIQAAVESLSLDVHVTPGTVMEFGAVVEGAALRAPSVPLAVDAARIEAGFENGRWWLRNVRMDVEHAATGRIPVALAAEGWCADDGGLLSASADIETGAFTLSGFAVPALGIHVSGSPSLVEATVPGIRFEDPLLPRISGLLVRLMRTEDGWSGRLSAALLPGGPSGRAGGVEGLLGQDWQAQLDAAGTWSSMDCWQGGVDVGGSWRGGGGGAKLKAHASAGPRMVSASASGEISDFSTAAAGVSVSGAAGNFAMALDPVPWEVVLAWNRRGTPELVRELIWLSDLRTDLHAEAVEAGGIRVEGLSLRCASAGCDMGEDRGGSLRIGADLVEWNGLRLGGLAAAAEWGLLRGSLAASGGWRDGAVRFNAAHTLDWTDTLSGDGTLVIPPSLLLGDEPLPSLVPALRGYTVTGTILGSFTSRIAGNTVLAAGTAGVSGLSLRSDDGATAVEGVNAMIEIADLAALRTAPGQKVLVDSVTLGSLRITRAMLGFSMDGLEHVRIDGASADIFGGTAELAGFDVSLSSPSADTSLRLRSIEGAEVMKLMPDVNARFTGLLEGRLPVIVDSAGFHLGTGQLTLVPGGEGSLNMNYPGLLTAGTSPSSPLYPVLRQVEDGLTALRVSEMSVLLYPPDAPGRSAQISIDGMPFDRVNRSRLRLDLNINAPLDQLVEIGAKLPEFTLQTGAP